jgi:uncharacterized Rmd1/YagE family protein
VHVLPVDAAWIRWSLYLEIELRVFVFSTAVKFLLDLLDILVFLVSDEGANDIGVILILFQGVNLFLVVRN